MIKGRVRCAVSGEMFTGIVQAALRVVVVEAIREGIRYGVQFTPSLCEGLVQGASVSIDGVCQTVVLVDADEVVWFEAIQETLRITTLDSLKVGQYVNIERSAVLGQEVGGHLLSGHIDSALSVVEACVDGDEPTMVLGYPECLSKYLFDKGYVGLHGCSLTIHRLDKSSRRFTICLIPETLRLTNLCSVRVGDELNVEIDRHTQAVVETVERVLASRP